MSERAERFIERLSEADTLASLEEAVLSTRDIFDVEHVVYHSMKADGEQWSAVTYKDEWVSTYVAEGMQSVDPVVKSCFRGFMPMDWKRLDWSSKAARRVLGEGIAHGVGNQGFSVPVRGPAGQFAVFTVNDSVDDDGWAKFSAQSRTDLLLSAHYINERVLTLTEPKAPTPPIRS